MGSKSFKIAFTLGLMASAALGFPACSSDETPSNPSPGGAGPGGSAGTGATGGGGSSGTGGTGGGTGGTAGSAPVVCGGVTCPTALDDYIPACCVNNKCGLVPPDELGLNANCVETNQPGDEDSSCYPDAGVPIDAGGLDAGNLLDGGVYVIRGCCRPDGKCGALLNFPDFELAFGCVDPTQYIDAGMAAPTCTP